MISEASRCPFFENIVGAGLGSRSALFVRTEAALVADQLSPGSPKPKLSPLLEVLVVAEP